MKSAQSVAAEVRSALSMALAMSRSAAQTMTASTVPSRLCSSTSACWARRRLAGHAKSRCRNNPAGDAIDSARSRLTAKVSARVSGDGVYPDDRGESVQEAEQFDVAFRRLVGVESDAGVVLNRCRGGLSRSVDRHGSRRADVTYPLQRRR
ncbi:hypothetical protein ACPPVO_21705 [Dactylosporangium sp. McL0621]|uniref:hypothetical protein n=1 Tax=Dactylosporangium sp. McL0621 TaxID=3415678 RepID=UPI003CEC464E